MTIHVEGAPTYGDMQFKIAHNQLYLVIQGRLIEQEDYDLTVAQVKMIK